MQTTTPDSHGDSPVMERSRQLPASGRSRRSKAGMPADAARARSGNARTPDADPATKAVDLELVQRAQRGETAAFDLLVSKYQHRVAALLGRYIADPSEREDVAQETFLRAYRGLDRFRGDSAFYTWLYRIAVNTATNHQVSAGRRPTSRGADPADAEEFEDGALLQDPDTPENTAAMGEVTQAIEQALASLPDSLRRAISLREMDGLTYDEIATAMECPIGTVRSRIARARSVIDAFIRPVLERPEAAGVR